MKIIPGHTVVFVIRGDLQPRKNVVRLRNPRLRVVESHRQRKDSVEYIGGLVPSICTLLARFIIHI